MTASRGHFSYHHQRIFRLKFLGFRTRSLSVFQQSRMPNPLKFEVRDIPHPECSQRLGLLSLPGRQSINTPHYFAMSSRGCVPHLSQDTMRGDTNIKGIYAALEDCQ